MKNIFFFAVLFFAAFAAGCSSSYEQVGCRSGDLKCGDWGQTLMRCDYRNEWQAYYDCGRDGKICVVNECVAPELEAETEVEVEIDESLDGDESPEETAVEEEENYGE